MLSPPSDASMFQLDELKTVTHSTNTEKQDVMISGLGFITIDKGATFSVRVPKSVDVTLRPSIM